MGMRPVIAPRNERKPGMLDASAQGNTKPIGLTTAALSATIIICLLIAVSSLRPWLYSGCAVLSLLIIYGSTTRATAFLSIPPWTTLACLNGIYCFTCTSWLQYRCFSAVCWPCVIITVLSLPPSASVVTRIVGRRILTQGHFITDKIAAFDLPALHLDFSLEGLLVVRGWTFSVSTLTIEVHGVELAQNVFKDMHLAVYCDEVVIRLFRGIEFGEIYGALKPEEFKVEHHSQLGNEKNGHLEARKQPFSKPPSMPTARELKDEKSGGPKNVEADSANNTTGLHQSNHKPTESDASTTSADSIAQSKYDDIRREIRNTSPVHQSLERSGGTPSDQTSPLDKQKTRAAACAELEHVPSVPHRSKRSIRLSTILDWIPRWVRRLLARMPLLLRLILMSLSYLHPVKVSCTAISISGSWLSSFMQHTLYSYYPEERDDIKKLQQTVSDWLTNATFCMDMLSIQGLAYVSPRSTQGVMSSWSCASSTVMRTESDTNVAAAAMRIEGMDGTCIVPSYLLPYHEHLLPARPSGKIGRDPNGAVEQPPGRTEDTTADDNAAGEADTAAIELRTHLNFPATLDASTVDFLGNLVECSVVMEIESDTESDAQSSHTDQSSLSRARSKVAHRAHNMRKSIKQGVKKVAMTKVAWNADDDDRIPSIVRKIAEHLESLHGVVGYAGSLPIPLGPFRGEGSGGSKWLP